MTTKNIQDVVAEKVEEFGRFTIMDGNKILLHGQAEEAEDWLRTTLTQYHQDLMSEVVEELEGMKRPALMVDGKREYAICDTDEAEWDGYNEAIDDIIKSLSK